MWDKEKKTEYGRRYYLENKDKQRENNRTNYLKNKENISESRRRYYLENKEKMRAYSRQRYRKNKEKKAAELKIAEMNEIEFGGYLATLRQKVGSKLFSMRASIEMKLAKIWGKTKKNK